MPGRTYTSDASVVGTDDVNSHGIKTKDVEDVPLVEFMYFIFTRMSGESYRRRLRSLLCLCCCRC